MKATDEAQQNCEVVLAFTDVLIHLLLGYQLNSNAQSYLKQLVDLLIWIHQQKTNWQLFW